MCEFLFILGKELFRSLQFLLSDREELFVFDFCVWLVEGVLLFKFREEAASGVGRAFLRGSGVFLLADLISVEVGLGIVFERETRFPPLGELTWGELA